MPMDNADSPLNARRPTMPPEPDAQQRWMQERMIEAMSRMSTATEQLTAVVGELRQVVLVLAARLARLEPAE